MYEPTGWAWWCCGLLFPAGVWANVGLEQGALSPLGLIPFAVVIALIYPTEAERRRRPPREPGASYPPHPDFRTVRTSGEWAAARKRAGVVFVVMLALVGAESVLRLTGFGFSSDY